MSSKFSTVRIGSRRKNFYEENLLMTYLNELKHQITYELTQVDDLELNKMQVELVIPNTGIEPLIVCQTTDNPSKKRLNKFLRDKFPDRIYKGSYDKVLDNIFNKVYHLV